MHRLIKKIKDYFTEDVYVICIYGHSFYCNKETKERILKAWNKNA